MVDKIPPHDIDCEEALLGALLIGADIESATISETDFYSERNRWVFEACKTLSERKVSLNQITVAQELAGKGKLEGIGGAAYLVHVSSICPTYLDYPYYCEIIHRLSLYRKLISASEQIAEIGYQASADVSQSLNKADDILLQLRKGVISNSIIDPVKRVELLNERYKKLYEMEGVMAISTGLKDLDNILGGGLFEGDLLIIGARPGMGKTTFLQNIGNHVAQKGNVLMYSCEMDYKALSDRDIAGMVGVPINTIRLGKYDPNLYCQITASLEDIEKTKLYIYDETPITTAKIIQSATNMKLRMGLSAIIVDYLGLLDDDIKENRNITLGYMTKKLKQVARELNIPVIVAHQLSRELERRDDKRPILSDLRESGHIEEDADNVIFLYRDSYYYDESEWKDKYGTDVDYPENVSELIVAKQRQGESNQTVRVFFDKKYQKFRDLVW